MQDPEVMLLDEPTNHFDIEMREALSLALQNYEGAVILVAHDKNLLESVVDEFWLVNDGQVNPFKGDLNDYQKWLNDNRWAKEKITDTNKTNSQDQPKEGQSALSRKDQKRIEAEIRKQKAPISNRLKKVDKEMHELQNEQSKLEALLASSEIYEEDNKKQLTDFMQRSNELDQTLEALEEEWFDLTEKLESFE